MEARPASQPRGGTSGSVSGKAAPVRRRGAVACRRCRRLRSKCVHETSSPPCEACRIAGPDAVVDCAFPRRGERDVDRQFRRRPVPSITTGDGDENGQARSTKGAGKGLLDERIMPSSPPGSTSSGRASSGSESRPSVGRNLNLSWSGDLENALPPQDEVVEGCRIFVTSYFQLGFIPKAVFLEGLVRDPGSVSKFLLSCILSISARFTPSLTRRYGSARRATEHFLEVARAMVPTEMYRPSLERIQAFFLLAISQWGNGERDRSGMDMGVAVRMAGLLKLHSEESYVLEEGSPADKVVRSESARRVFWMIQSQENLHSGYNTPAPFPLEDITTLLPCNEADFAFGAVPAERAAVAGTPPALANPQLVFSPRRCLFATLIQAHGLWGKVARRACRTDYNVSKAPPWDPQSEFQRNNAELRVWEDHLPPKHAFSVWNLRGWKSESLHLAYLSVTMVLRLSNIVTRRIYLDDMLSTLTNSPIAQPLEPSTPTMANANDKCGLPHLRSSATAKTAAGIGQSYGTAPPDFWAKTSNELFSNVWGLHEQVDAYFSMRDPDEGFPQILVFCVYMCGSLASYLWRCPELCPQLGERAEMMAQRSLEVLSELHAAWPTSTKWQKGLQQIATPMKDGMPMEGNQQEQHQNTAQPIYDTGYVQFPHHQAQGQFQQQQTQHLPHVNNNDINDSLPLHYHDQMAQPLPMDQQRPTVPEGMLGELINALPYGGGDLARLGNMQMNALPNELFGAEINAFLQGNFHYDVFDGWQTGND